MHPACLGFDVLGINRRKSADRIRGWQFVYFLLNFICNVFFYIICLVYCWCIRLLFQKFIYSCWLHVNQAIYSVFALLPFGLFLLIFLQAIWYSLYFLFSSSPFLYFVVYLQKVKAFLAFSSTNICKIFIDENFFIF